MPKSPISFLTSVLFLMNQIQEKATLELRLNIPLPIAPAPTAPTPSAFAPTMAPAASPAVPTPTVAQSGTSSLLSQGPAAAATLVEASRYAVLASPMGESKNLFSHSGVEIEAIGSLFNWDVSEKAPGETGFGDSNSRSNPGI